MINKINLNNFGIHRKLDINFVPGINAIIGRNRRGKTHIMEAICFSLFGKTQNSTLDKLINFESKDAIVEITLDNKKFSRKRTRSQSNLNDITKLELDNKLSIDYNEFLSIFYISSHEQKSLFDPSYLRKFLINIFNLNKYSKNYERLSAEYKGLQAANKEIKKVNIDLIKKRINKVNSYLIKIKENNKVYVDAEEKINKISRKIDCKRGELRVHNSQIQKKLNQINKDKCSSCGQIIAKQYKNNILNKINEATLKIKKFESILRDKELEIAKKKIIIKKHLDKFNDRNFKGRQILSRLQDKLKSPVCKSNSDRIKLLDSILPIINPKGFPAYLLKIYIPVIIETTNQLLQVIFPDMSVSIRTEKPESNQPDFKPLINKGDNIQEMTDLCGSERAIVNLCFRLGIMVIYKQLCNTCIDFFLVDEGFEKVDNENSLEVIKLFESFMSMGYLKQIFLVTHKDILKKLRNINYTEV